MKYLIIVGVILFLFWDKIKMIFGSSVVDPGIIHVPVGQVNQNISTTDPVVHIPLDPNFSGAIPLDAQQKFGQGVLLNAVPQGPGHKVFIPPGMQLINGRLYSLPV